MSLTDDNRLTRKHDAPPEAADASAPRPAPVVSENGKRSARVPRLLAQVREWLRENTYLPHWLPRGWTHPLVAYAVAILLQFAVAVVSVAVAMMFPDFPFKAVFFALAVVFVASAFGAGPGLVATIVNVLLLAWIVLPPSFETRAEAGVDLVGVVFVFLVFLSMTLLVSQRERARRVAQESLRRMDEFLGIAGHELRTPLTVLKLTVATAQRRLRQTLRGEDGDVTQMRQQMQELLVLMERADDQMRRQNRLVSDLLDASRLQAGKFEVRLQPVNLALLVRTAVEEQRLAHPERTISLALPPEPVVPVLADPDRIVQLLTNYVDNAVKYADPATPIAVALQCDGGFARASVRDQGPGLSERDQRLIWTVFHRAEGVEVQSGSSVGLGLGLYIARSIAERHGGQVGVESAPGAGATFWFTLPLAPTGGA